MVQIQDYVKGPRMKVSINEGVPVWRSSGYKDYSILGFVLGSPLSLETALLRSKIKYLGQYVKVTANVLWQLKCQWQSSTQ